MTISFFRFAAAAAFCMAVSTPALSAQEGKKSAREAAPEKPAPAGEDASGNDLLKTAITVMSGLTSYHVSGTFTAGGATATLTGDFGVGAVDLRVKGFDKKTTFRRAVKDKFFISEDSGKTWKEDPANDMTILFSNIVTVPLSAESKAWEQGEFKIVGEEKIGKEDVLHVQKPKEGESEAMDFWLARDKKLGLVVRRASLVIAANDGDFPVVMTYTKLNEPLTVAAPAVPAASPGDKKEK